MEYSWLSLVPPLIVILITAYTHRLNMALLAGIGVAALIATHGSPTATFELIASRFWSQIIDIDKAYLYVFLISIGTLIALFNSTGCARAFASWIGKKIRSAREAQNASVLLSFLLFIDDYLSILTNGYVMHNLTDRYGVARVKLAFLIHSLAGSVVILAPVSSWVAAITTYLSEAGVNSTNNEATMVLTDPFYLYLKSVPFIFYSFLIIGSVIYIVQRKISFGPMQSYELEAKKNIIFAPNEKVLPTHSWEFLDLLLPIATLLTTVLIGIPLAGGFPRISFMDAIRQNNQTFLIMCIGGLLGLALGAYLAHRRKTLAYNEYPKLITEGFDSMKSTIILILFASALGILMREDLHTGQFLANLLLDFTTTSILPALLFFTSLITALATGSAWGTMALLIPLAIPMVTSLSQLPIPAHPNDLLLIAPALGAIFSGAVCGNHISPFADVTIMAAQSAGVTPIEHCYTQLPYAVPAILASILGFLALGYLTALPLWMSCLISLGLSMVLCFGMLEVANKLAKNKKE